MANLKPQIPLMSEGDYIYPLTTIDQVLMEDGTKANQTLATKEYVNNMIPFSLGIDENGNYGYIKEGADTVTPFNRYEFSLAHSEVTKEDAAKTYTYTVLEKGKYLIKMFNTSCEGYNSTFTVTTTNGTNTIFADDDVISATTSKSRTRILLAICDMESGGVISCAKTSAAGYGVHGIYIYKIN